MTMLFHNVVLLKSHSKEKAPPTLRHPSKYYKIQPSLIDNLIDLYKDNEKSDGYLVPQHIVNPPS